MTRIGLILTGESERGGLPQALTRAFPQATFELVPGIHDGFTCAPIQPPFRPEPPLQTTVEVLVSTLLGAVTDRKDSYDFAIVLDDLEVENWGRAQDVCDYFRQAADHQLTRETASARRAMRERCSFHLLHPMLESIFFGDHRALVVAGVPPTITPQRSPGDPEQFRVTDPGYLSAPEEPKKSRRRGIRRWAVANRMHKPKHYVIYLSEQAGGTPYHETEGGVAALGVLDWSKVLKAPSECVFTRAIFEDIASMIGVSNPHPGALATETWAPRPSTLRNL